MNAFLHRPQSVRLRRALFQLHLWLGLAAGLYISIVCVTGAALVFRIDMQRAEYPHLFTASADGRPAAPLTIMERVRQAYPAARLSGVEAPTTSRPTYLAYVTKGSEFRTVLVDPVSARVLGELPERSWTRTLQELHFDLLAGRAGRMINGIGAVLLLVMCATGLVIWWPGVANWRRGVTIDIRRSWKRLTWDLHSAVGIWAAAFVAMWAITGIYFAFPEPFRRAVNVASPLSVTRAPRSGPSAGRPSLAWGVLLDRARAQARAAHVARVVVPARPDGVFLVMFTDRVPTPAGAADLESVYLDQFTGARLQADRRAPTAGDAVLAWIAPLHVGSFGGITVRAAWVVLGLAPPLLFVTGVLMWFLRVVRRRRTGAATAAEA